MRGPTNSIAFDHLSLEAEPGALEALGSRVTPTAGAPDHARVLLDRCYLEVTAAAPGTGLRATGWFLRPGDLPAAAAALRATGIAAEPSRYEGRDGTWDDLHLPGHSPAIPTLTRRRDGEGEWPPPLSEPHPNRAVGVAELRLRTSEPHPLATYLTALGAPPAPGEPPVACSPEGYKEQGTTAAIGFELAGGVTVAIEVGDEPDVVVGIELLCDDGRQLSLPLR